MKEAVFNYFSFLKKKVNELTLRERILLLVTGAIFIYLMTDSIFMTPIRQEVVQNQEDKEIQQRRVEGTLRELSNLENSFNNKMNANEKNQYGKLQSTLTEKKATLQKLSIELMPPQKIPLLLEQLVNELSGLNLTAVLANETNSTDLKTDGFDNILHHFKISLTLSGEYYQLFQYLKKIESLPYPIRWEEVEYKVTTFPQAKIMLNLYVVFIHDVSKKHEGMM